jgi:hypothetical protein
MYAHAVTFTLLSALSAAAMGADKALPANPVLALNEGAPSLVLPGSDWIVHNEQRNRTGTGIYYMLSNDKLKTYFSVYIEKTNSCSAAAECLKLSFKNESYATAESRTDFDAAPFSATSFFIDAPRGLPIKQAHVLASAYVNGHWIDIHLSAAGPERPSVAPLQALLQSLSVRSAP